MSDILSLCADELIRRYGSRSLSPVEVTRAALERPSSAYDSHPAPAARIAWVERLRGSPGELENGAPAWDLLEDRSALEAIMTDVIEERLRRLAASVPEDEEAQAA